MKKILIALDYNPTAQTVAETGYKVAKALKAHVILLHVIADNTYLSFVEFSPMMGYGGFTNPEALQPTNIDSIRSASQDFLDKSKKHLGGKDIETIIEEGDFSDAILKVAKEKHADMIVMGSHNRRGLEKMLMGNLAEEVLEHSTIPLLIVPTKED